MRHIVCAVVLAAVLGLVAPNIALSGDYITDAVQALKQAPVYVAPGTEGTDKDTAAKLQARLTSDDNIVLVMLPAAAEAELKMDAGAIASRLSDGLDNQRIIGLAVGRKVAGYGPTLPAGVVADQMQRAESVSNDSVTALGTFVQNMHLWLKEHPQPTPTPIPSTQKGGDLSWLACLVILVIAAAIVAALSTSRATPTNMERTRFNAPDQVKNLLARIVRDRVQVNDLELKGVLYQLCVDIEKYFQKSSKDRERDALFFKDRLTEVTRVLDKYIEVQQNPRYYDNPGSELRKGKEAMTDFSQYVLTSIRRGYSADLLEYTVSTQILQAQRYR